MQLEFFSVTQDELDQALNRIKDERTASHRALYARIDRLEREIKRLEGFIEEINGAVLALENPGCTPLYAIQ